MRQAAGIHPPGANHEMSYYGLNTYGGRYMLPPQVRDAGRVQRFRRIQLASRADVS